MSIPRKITYRLAAILALAAALAILLLLSSIHLKAQTPANPNPLQSHSIYASKLPSEVSAQSANTSLSMGA